MPVAEGGRYGTPEYTIDAIELREVPVVVRIHRTVLPDSFLSQLGPRVLAQIYAGAVSAPGTTALALRTGGHICGFVLGTPDMRALFRHVLRRRAAWLVPLLLREVVRRPAILGRVLESPRYPSRVEASAEGSDGELVALGVLPELRGSGCGAALVRALEAAFVRQGVRAYRVSSYDDNEAARSFYEQCGFKRVRTFSMYGRAWATFRIELTGGDEPGAQPSA